MTSWVKVRFGSYPKDYSYLYDLGHCEVGDELQVEVSGIVKNVTCVAAFKGNPPVVATKYIRRNKTAEQHSVNATPYEESSLTEAIERLFEGGINDIPAKGDKMFNSNKFMNKFFRKVNDMRWDLVTGNLGFKTSSGIITLAGEGPDAHTVETALDDFSMQVPAFAQNKPLDTVAHGDFVYQADGVRGWVISNIADSRDLKLLQPDGVVVDWRLPKDSMFDFGGGPMIVRSLFNMFPEGSEGMANIQSSMIPFMLMSGSDGSLGDIEDLMPIMLFGQLGLGDGSGFGGNVMQTMLMMKMLNRY